MSEHIRGAPNVAIGVGNGVRALVLRCLDYARPIWELDCVLGENICDGPLPVTPIKVCGGVGELVLL